MTRKVKKAMGELRVPNRNVVRKTPLQKGNGKGMGGGGLETGKRGRMDYGKQIPLP